MTRYNAHIALIAYVLGGWLLPAAHHHHAHLHDDHGRGEACQHTHAANTHDDGQQIACHGHDHGRTNVVSEPIGEHQLLAGERAKQGCVGLCAICSARTLSSPRLRDGTLSFAAASMARVSAAADPQCPISWHGGTHFSRGPPRSSDVRIGTPYATFAISLIDQVSLT